MKKILLLISIFMISCMTGCGTKEQIEYAQSQLPKPDRIEVRRGDSIVTYENDSDKYQQIYESLSANWWKTAEDKAYSINEQDMTAVRNLKEERTTSKDRFAGDVEACIRLLYEDSPMLWTKSSVLDAEIGEINFVLPHYPIEDEQTKGHYIVFNAERPSVNEGLYHYYYSNELFEALSENGKKVSTLYSEQPLKIDLQYFSDLTFEEVESKLISNNSWTHLEEHKLYWNPITQQIAINYIFSKKTPEDELESSRDYWTTMQYIYNSLTNFSSYSDIYNLYERLPKNAEVIIQVYAEDELVSQDVYGDVEDNIVYKVIRYEK